MFHLNKTSQLVTVSPDVVIADYESQLNSEGLTGGYHPFSGKNADVGSCLKARTPNLYFLKYGGIEELCVGGAIKIGGEKSFQLKTAPRSATGCDLRRVVIGSNALLGEYTEATLRVFPQPEAQIWGVVFLRTAEAACASLKRMIGLFIRPLFAAIFEEEGAEELKRFLKLVEEGEAVLVFKLAGVRSMVEAEKDCLQHVHEAEKVSFYWPREEAEAKLLDERLIIPETCLNFLSRFSPLVGRNPNTPATSAEEKLRRYLEKNPICSSNSRN